MENENWILTKDKEHPDKPGKDCYEQIPCLVLYKGKILLRQWNCEHRVWDTEDGDDFFCNTSEVTQWMVLPEPKKEIPNKSELPNNSEPTLVKVWQLKWRESSAGWGSQDDGYSYHLKREDVDKFVEDYWYNMPKEIPDEYSIPNGNPVIVLVRASFADTITGNGIRKYDTESVVR